MRAKRDKIPRFVADLVKAYEQGKVLVGGPRIGKTWAMNIILKRQKKK